MGVQSLGIDISDSHLTAVVLEQQRKRLVLNDCLSLPLADGADPAALIRQLCQQLDWKGGACVCGVPLSMLSVRNLTLPFKDVKKIAQILPFELEEQLLAPIDTLVTDFLVGKKEDAGASVVAFSLEKAFLGDLLEAVRDVVDPDVVTPAMAALAGQLARQSKVRPDFLLIHADWHSSAMVLVLHGQAVFFRRLSYPEEMILHPPFHFEEGRVEIPDQEAASECIRLFSRSVERSLEFFRVENKEEGRPERVVLTGPLAEAPLFAEIVQADLGLPVEAIDLLAANTVFCPEALRPQWHGQYFDRALSLALQGFKRAELNFRKEGLAKKRPLFSSRKQVLGALGAAAVMVIGLFAFLGYDYYRLQQRDRALHEEMVAVFKKTFPGVTKVQDPLVEMQARIKSAQGPASPVLFLHRHKRVLGLLADISARIPATVTLRVSRLAIDRESVALKGTTDTYNAVEIIKSSLAGSPKFKSVQIVSATADKDKKNSGIRFEVQLQLEGL